MSVAGWGLGLDAAGKAFGAFGDMKESQEAKRDYKDIEKLLYGYRQKDYMNPSAIMSSYDPYFRGQFVKQLGGFERRFGWNSGQAVGAAVGQSYGDRARMYGDLQREDVNAQMGQDQAFQNYMTQLYGARHGGK